MDIQLGIVKQEKIDIEIKEEVSFELIEEESAPNKENKEESILHRQIKEEVHENEESFEGQEMEKMEFDFIKVENNLNLNEEPDCGDPLAFCTTECESHSTEEVPISTAADDPGISQNNDMLTHEEEEMNINLYTWSKCVMENDVDKFNRIHEGVKLKCPYCNNYYSCSRRNNLKIHIMRMHMKQKLYKCQHCDYSSSTKYDLKMHNIRIHTKEKPYKCPQCNFSCVAQNKLKIHIIRMHTKEKPYKCTQCEYSYATLDSLKNHVTRKHTSEKPYKCPQCDYSSVTQYELKIHIIRMHTKEKPYKCTQCEYSYTTLDSLKIHEKKKHKSEKSEMSTM